jgi:hypothetical protein
VSTKDQGDTPRARDVFDLLENCPFDTSDPDTAMLASMAMALCLLAEAVGDKQVCDGMVLALARWVFAKRLDEDTP